MELELADPQIDRYTVKNSQSDKTRYLVSVPFEAARQISSLPDAHRCSGLHGHSFLAGLRCALPAGFASYPGGELEALQAQWRADVAQLDYRLINDQIASPTDLNIARWLQTQCRVTPAEQIALQSTPQSGVEIDAGGGAVAWRRYAFQSAHQLPRVPAGHKCGNMHGHGFEAILHVQLAPHQTDAFDAYATLDAAWEPLQAVLDYACLNDLPGLDNPTSEMMSSWIWNQLKAPLPWLTRVTVYETASCGASFDGAHYSIWKDLTLDSAVRFKAAPLGTPRRQLHGHTYTLRLHLSAPLDQVMGWTVDFGDVKELFNPLFKALDHKPLYEIADLADCDTATIAHWILAKARANLPQVSGVDLYETGGCGVCVVRN
jgi:6-pyruvoyltetrahydropterin/6-carboxytetrahydropterin synthase